MMIIPQLHAQTNTKVIKNWINWNGVFKPGYDSVQRQNVIEGIKSEIAAFSSKTVVDVKKTKGKITSYLRKYAGKSKNQMVITRIVTQYCSCNDTLLWNVRADVEVRGRDTTVTGLSQPGVIPPKPPTRPSGDPLALFSRNELLNTDFNKPAFLDIGKVVTFGNNTSVADNAVIAVLDTGIDTTLLDERIRNAILWNGPSGSRNLLLDADVNNYMDDYVYRHGTAVASIALNSFYQASDSTELPKLMVLKVLDKLGSGSIFELCCAISYATENHATLINASMGYYGLSDNVLEYYVNKSHRDSIPLIAAAGNIEGSADSMLVCSESINDNGRLTSPDRLFYPACLAATEQNNESFGVISVTGFSSPGTPCYFQNFSERFVTLGVYNERTESNCCSYRVPFIKEGFVLEGSSFATPVVSGRLTYNISRTGRHFTVSEYLNTMNVINAAQAPAAASNVSQGNQYITY
jgi:hypothetical protein